ncbi:MAG TPA: penicillin-binding transpeptidase domain-containing protein [Rhodothermales bacterium]
MGPKDQIEARVYWVLLFLCVLPVLVTVQVLRIHLGQGEALREEGERQVQAIESIPAKRGAILDQAGRALVVNTGRYELAVDPTVPGWDRSVASRFFDRLSAITGIRASAFHRMLRERSSPKYVRLVRDLTDVQKEELESMGIPGLIFHPRFSRRYNYGTTAAHVLGYVDADGHGIAGLELQYEPYLWGEPGRRMAARDRRGVLKASVEGPFVEPEDGESIVLTIDLIRQTIMEEELARGVQETGANWGTAIAMDPHTGAILALANSPTYDPNRPATASAAARRNHAVTDRIEPGSTFKLVTAVAAVEEGIVTLDDPVDTGPGYAVFGGRRMRDTHAHGVIPFREVISQSSNIGAAKTAARLKPGVFYQYVRNLGFGQPTWVDLPGEVAGTLRRPSDWSGTTQTSMAIGYAVDATPLQILTAYAALANGGLLVKPYVVAERRDPAGRVTWRARADSVRRVVRRETIERILPAFEEVVTEGTGTRAQVEGLRIAGKTGTAIKSAGEGYRAGAYRSSFVGFFPADDPRVVMIVVMDEPRTSGYGGIAAAPVFQRIAARWVGTLPEVAQRMAPTDSIAPPGPRPVPDVSGKPASVARDLLFARGLVPVHESRAARGFVSSQEPVSPAAAPPGTPVRLVTTDASAERIPGVIGMPAREALHTLAARGIRVRIQGSGVVVQQTPASGSGSTGEVLLVCR